MKKFLAFFLVVLTGNIFAQNTIIAIVNDNPISLNLVQSKLLTASSNEEIIDIINIQIDNILQLQKASEFNLKPTKEDIENVLIDIAGSNDLTLDELKAFEEFHLIKKKVSQKISILNLQKFITKDLEIPFNQILNACSVDNSAKDQKQIRIAQIIISEIDSKVYDVNQKNSLIRSFLDKLSNHIKKGASFQAFAKLHSQHPSYKNGGITSWLAVNNPTLEMLDSLKENEVSEIYLTDFGFAIAIKIDEKFISSKLKECEEQIIYTNAEKYYSDWLKNLRKDAYIEIYYDKLF